MGAACIPEVCCSGSGCSLVFSLALPNSVSVHDRGRHSVPPLRRDLVPPRVSAVRRARYHRRTGSRNRARSRAPRLAGRDDDQWRPDNPSFDLLRSQYDSIKLTCTGYAYLNDCDRWSGCRVSSSESHVARNARPKLYKDPIEFCCTI